jgi:hypothetical protein
MKFVEKIKIQVFCSETGFFFFENLAVYEITRKNTGSFITYSGITKIYYRKTVGHVFTKPVQIEGTTEIFFPPARCFLS